MYGREQHVLLGHDPERGMSKAGVPRLKSQAVANVLIRYTKGRQKGYGGKEYYGA